MKTTEGLSAMWLRLDDRFPTHPKVLGLSDRAFRFHVMAMAWAAGNLTDGHVPRKYGEADARSARELVKAGLWEQNGEGWVIHDWLDYNPAAEQVQERRKAEAERLRELRRRRKPPQ
jgi:hypothetical protein